MNVTTRVSLRRAALLWMTVLLTAVGIVTIVIAYWYARGETAEFLDGQLRQIALNAGTGLPAVNAPGAVDRDPEDEFAIAIWDGDGRLVHQSLPQVAILRQDRPGFADVEAGGHLWRVYSARSGDRTVQVAQRDTVRAEIANGTALGTTAPILIVIPLSWLVVGWAMNRALRPLSDLSDHIAARTASATEPISLAGVPSEIAPLVESMNGLIARLRATVEAQKRFVADAAHELRTPLAAMQIEVDNLGGAATGVQNARVAALSAGVRRASALTNQLLELARLDEPLAASPVTFDLGALLLDCVSVYAPLADRKGVDLGANVIPAISILGVEGEAHSLFANLIENAVRYTPPGGTVDVSLDRSDGGFVATIVDTGPGLPEGAETRIFDRFYRGASRNSEGTGLGLAIARRVAERHGFALSVENRRDGVSGVVARVSGCVSHGYPSS
ncbi:MAG: sensor histidine kinase N-terminal domain-containing protein [Hyphomicrobiales bacterium]|nr:sensor histidine kinase N-terminal domain-containing protein [Hyphomicrobiales bacterium]